MRSEPVAAHVFPEFILPAVVSGHRDADSFRFSG